MKPITDYKKDNHLRLLLQGPPGSGKTTLACHMPGAYILDLDVNLGGPLRHIEKNGGIKPVGYDTVDIDDKGVVIEMKDRYQRMSTLLNNALHETSVQTIVVDSTTRLSDYIQGEVLRQNGKSDMTLQLWGHYLMQWKHFISQLITVRKHIVVIAHERVEKDEVDQSLKYFIAISGQFQHIIGSMFTDVWRCEVAVAGTNPPKYTFQVRTMPDFRYQLKNSLDLPPIFKFDWGTIASKLK